MPNYKKIKPTLTAIPTQYGWVEPKTGELLVSIKGGCDDPVEGFKLNTPWIEPEKPVKKDKKSKKEVIEQLVEEIITPIIENVPEEVIEPIFKVQVPEVEEVLVFTEKDAVEPIVVENSVTE